MFDFLSPSPRDPAPRAPDGAEGLMWRSLASTSADAICLTDRDGRIAYINDSFSDLLKQPSAALAGQAFQHLGIRAEVGDSRMSAMSSDGWHGTILVPLLGGQTLRLRAQVHRYSAGFVGIFRTEATGEARLRQALTRTIVAMSRTLETHDPYTAEHQRRVAVLGRAIALELGIDEDTADGIYLGGMLHDIGKLYIPNAILGRAERLNAAEFLLVKTHCAVGHDLVKEIDFPWPLASMIHQHHERLDGSGYPRRLQGEEILFSARILAVADVIDAMSSPRPYRAALGIDTALAEIANGRGRLYEPLVVDACLRLFRELGFDPGTQDPQTIPATLRERPDRPSAWALNSDG